MNKPTDTPSEKQSKEVESFLDCIFAEMEEDEEIPFWASSKPFLGFPKDESTFLKSLRRSKKPKACYFGTSTMFRDPEGSLYNRQSQFAGFYILVLDDIGMGSGSKIASNDLPPGLSELATYRIETSPNNEQWGFVLDRPIRDLEIAKAFLREMVQRSGADQGGCMPNKLVRMPLGVNLKEKYQVEGGDPFECQFLEFHPKRWSTPEELFSAVDVGFAFEDLKSNTNDLRSSTSRKSGTTAYRAKPVYQASLEGIVDPVLEWLNESNQIVTERGEWVDILCPWASEHSDKNATTAGYAPIGIGSEPDRRGFHCFHDSCKGNRTSEFLAHVLAAGGPRSSPKSPIEALISRYAFDMGSNRAIDMKSLSLEGYPHQGFKNQLSTGVWVPDASGKFRSVSEYSLYMADPNRLRLAGCDHIPGGDRILESDSGGWPRLNRWRLPGWGDGEFDPSIVARFEEFIRYLLPNEGDADWFLDHLAAKTQDPLYRGPGVVMTTPVEGTGRGTLAKILELLWGYHNIGCITLSAFLKGAAALDNNAWIVRDWLVVSEGKETGMSVKIEYTAYETLKGFIEPGGVSIWVKDKWVVAQQTMCFGATIICSNHGDVLPVDSGSTRFRRMENTVEPWSYDQFKELYSWMGSGFEPHVWRWLRSRDLSGFDLRAREKPLTLVEDTRRALETQRSVDAAIGLCLAFAEEHTNGIVFVQEFITYLRLLSDPLGLDFIHGWEKPLRRELRNKTRELIKGNGKRWRPRFGEKSIKIRSTVQPIGIALNNAVLRGEGEDLDVMKRASSFDLDTLKDQFIQYCLSAIDDIG